MALCELHDVLVEVDRIEDSRERQYTVMRGLLAGNVFDWGAKEVVKRLESSSCQFTFQSATAALQG